MRELASESQVDSDGTFPNSESCRVLASEVYYIIVAANEEWVDCCCCELPKQAHVSPEKFLASQSAVSTDCRLTFACCGNINRATAQGTSRVRYSHIARSRGE